MSHPSGNKDFFGTTQQIFEQMEDLAQVGGWVLDVKTGQTHWTSQVYKIHDLDELISTDFERGINYYTQPSRGMINQAVSNCINRGEPFRLKLQIKSATGVLKEVSVAGKAVQENGEVVKVYGAIQDITESEKQLRALLDEQTKVSKAQSISNFGYYETDLVNNTWVGSDRFYEIFGFDKHNEPFTTEEFQAIVHPEDLAEVMKEFGESLANKKDFYAEYRCINRKDKGVIWVKSTSKVEYDVDGNPVRILGVKFDITEFIKLLKKVEKSNKELESRNQQLQEYAYITSHDLKSPLNNIMSFLELISEDVQEIDNPELKGYLDYVLEASERMKLQITTLLDHARIGVNRVISKVDMEQLLKKLISDLRVDIRESQAKIDFKDLPEVKGDAVELRILLQNLISNAIKYRDYDKELHIEVSCTEEEHFYHFTVEDNGLGIDQKYHESIFEMFARTQESQNIKGTGIGLAQSKKIVNLHNGSIWVESSLGVGSAFHFTIAKTTD